MDLMKMGQQLLGDKLGDNAGGMMDALSSLTSGEGLDIGGIVYKLKAGGLGEQCDACLGDGDNQEMSAEQVKNAFGDEEMANVAQKLGVDQDTAASQLSDVLPGLMDKASSGGSLMDQFGGAGGLLGAAKGMLNK